MARRIAMIGHGTLGRWLAGQLVGGALPDVALTAIMTRRGGVDGSHGVAHVTRLEDLLSLGPDLVVEAAGTEAFAAHVPAILESGVDVLAVSSAALAAPETESAVRSSAERGSARLLLASGAVGAIDALTAAREGTLEQVTVIQRKPPAALLPAEEAATLTQVRLVKQASAREVALSFPKNANIVATIALAGVGFDRTEVKVFADPSARSNSVELLATGTFGDLRLVMNNRPAADNPRSSLTPAMSVLAALRRGGAAVVIPA